MCFVQFGFIVSTGSLKVLEERQKHQAESFKTEWLLFGCNLSQFVNVTLHIVGAQKSNEFVHVWLVVFGQNLFERSVPGLLDSIKVFALLLERLFELVNDAVNVLDGRSNLGNQHFC